MLRRVRVSKQIHIANAVTTRLRLERNDQCASTTAVRSAAQDEGLDERDVPYRIRASMASSAAHGVELYPVICVAPVARACTFSCAETVAMCNERPMGRRSADLRSRE